MLDLITILGPTASGKTSLAVALAAHLDTEIISADSRQIYRSMDIGTGKDLSEYTYEEHAIPYHLIDICPPGYKYNLFEYIRDYNTAYADIINRGKTPILCRGYRSVHRSRTQRVLVTPRTRKQGPARKTC